MIKGSEEFTNAYFHPSDEYIKSTKTQVEFIDNNIELQETTDGYVAKIKQEMEKDYE